MCGTILVKLILDMWLAGRRSGTKAAFPLAMLVLRRCFASDDAVVRARAFDLLYNTSVHGELLFRSGCDMASIFDGGEAAAEVAVTGGRATAPEADAQLDPFRRWLRYLLFEMLTVATVVSVALHGCLLQWVQVGSLASCSAQVRVLADRRCGDGIELAGGRGQRGGVACGAELPAAHDVP